MTLKRISAGHYRDTDSGFSIMRRGGSVGRHERVDWRVIEPDGSVARVEQSKAEAEMAMADIMAGRRSVREP